jgi:hypothetical protein
LASIDGIHRNSLLPPRSTGSLLAEGLPQAGLSQPTILEGYNVEKTTRAVLVSGQDGRGSRIGNLLADTATALGGIVVRWEPMQDGSAWHLRL